MTKHITLNNEDLTVIKHALIHLHESSIINPTVYPEYALASQQRMYQIMAKLGIERNDEPVQPTSSPKETP